MSEPHSQAGMISQDGPRITRIATDESLEFQVLSVPIRVIRGSFLWLRSKKVVLRSIPREFAGRALRILVPDKPKSLSCRVA
jgi:hypothetical protein